MEHKGHYKGLAALAVVGMLVSYGCGGPSTPAEMTSFDPSHDQLAIAFYYKEEAATLQQKAKELTSTAELYEELFGPDSDQVKSTRMLAQFYQEAALQRERLAEAHQTAAAAGRRHR